LPLLTLGVTGSARYEFRPSRFHECAVLLTIGVRYESSVAENGKRFGSRAEASSTPPFSLERLAAAQNGRSKKRIM
jgi:hypothetical protein